MGDGHVTLGHSVIPENYRLEIDADTKTFRFKGKVVIRCVAKPGTKLIRLNARDLKIKYAKVRSKDLEQKATIGMTKKNDEICLRLKNGIRGHAEIEIGYQGKNTDSLKGFYRSAYTYKKRKEYMLTTHLEPADAREVLPCFDEPEFKASFDVSITTDKKLDVISNTDVKEVVNLKSKKTVTFHTSPKMSSYLLFIAVGRFEYLRTKHRNTTIRVITTPGKIKYGSFSLGVAKKSLQFYERYFGIRYPLKKLDLIGAPDFSVGAMENWGAILFRETELLCDSENPSKTTRQHIAETVAHEIAHQWFGNLVTMQWWDDTWLNESFASIIAFRALDAIYPKWKIMEQFPLDGREGTDIALSADQLRKTHPISMPVGSVELIAGAFDLISYAKGSNVLVMLEDYVGQDVYRDGLHIYLKKHAYSNATKEDLWNAIDSAARRKRRKVKALEVARHWVEKEGYPIVEVYKTDHALHLSQKRYTLSERKEVSSERWPIPINYVTDAGQRESTFMRGSDHDVKIDNAKWVKLNYGQKGFYRVRYVEGLLDDLGQAVQGDRLNGVDSWGIENDLFTLVRSGRLRMRKYIKFISKYCMESKYPMNMSISDHLGWLRSVSYGQSYRKDIDHISREYHLLLLKRLGWRKRKSDSTIDAMLRARSISALSKLEHAPTVRKLDEMFRAYRKNRKAFDADLIYTSFISVAWNGKLGDYNRLVKMYEKEENPDLRIKLLASIGNFRGEKLVKKALEFSKSGKVRLQDSYVIPMFEAANPENKGIMLGWTFKNWKRFRSIYGPSVMMLDRFVKNLGINNDAGTRSQISEFFKRKNNIRTDIERPVGQTLEIIDANITFIKKNNEQ